MRVLILSLVILASFVGVVILFGSIYIHFFFKRERKIENEILRKEQHDFNAAASHKCKICGSQQPSDSPICLECGTYKLPKEPDDPEPDRMWG
jgi:hypothetical protein